MPFEHTWEFWVNFHDNGEHIFKLEASGYDYALIKFYEQSVSESQDVGIFECSWTDVGTKFAPKRWRHIALTVENAYSSLGHTAQFYIDGVLQMTELCQEWTYPSSVPNALMHASGTDMQLVEVVVWNYVKETMSGAVQTECEGNCTLCSPLGYCWYCPDTLVANYCHEIVLHWEIFESAGSQLYDSTSNFKHGDITGSYSFIDDGIRFDGQGEVSVAVPDNSYICYIFWIKAYEFIGDIITEDNFRIYLTEAEIVVVIIG